MRSGSFGAEARFHSWLRWPLLRPGGFLFDFVPADESPFIGSPPVQSEKRVASDVTCVEPLRRASIWLLTISIIIAGAFATISGLRIDLVNASRSLLVLAGILLASAMMAKSTRGAKFSDCLGAQAIVGLGGLACGFISLIGLHLHFPTVDDTLRAIDRATGLDGPAFAVSISHAPGSVQALLHWAYWLAAPVLILSLLVQSLRQQRLELWRAAFCFIGGLLNVCLISIVTPARGIGVWLSEETLAHLPPRAARYFWNTFDAFYEGRQVVLQTGSVDGVVSFPSFHIVMGLITVTLWQGQPIMLLFSLVWFVSMVAATVPIGGHYFTDLIAGVAIWAIWFSLSERMTRGRPTGFALNTPASSV